MVIEMLAIRMWTDVGFFDVLISVRADAIIGIGVDKSTDVDTNTLVAEATSLDFTVPAALAEAELFC